MRWLTLILLASLAAAQCPPTTGASISACGGVPTTCGFPGYSCSLQTWNTIGLQSLTAAPPAAGSQTAGGALHACTAGITSLINCGNLYGTNTVITETDYHNVQILRATDYVDVQEGCIPIGGMGGASEYNLFDSSDSYFLMSCTGDNRMKWFDPATFRIVTTGDPAGQVKTSGGAIAKFSTQTRAAYTTPATFFEWTNTQVVSYTISNGVSSAASSPVMDYVYAVPCWSSVQTCADWQANHIYSPGANVLPTTGNATNPHSFQLITSPASCTSGGTRPDFLAATANPSSVNNSKQYVIDDGTCQWADMDIPPKSTGGRIYWTAGAQTDLHDAIFGVALSNNTITSSGQDARGACYALVYDSTNKTYHHLNTCTGNVYNTVCNGGTGYNCTGGSFSQSYVGNVYSTDNTYGWGARKNAIVMHNHWLSKGGGWVDITLNNCALTDLASGSNPVCADPGGVTNEYYWKVGTADMLNAYDWLGTGTPGHDFPGINNLIYSEMSRCNPNSNIYQARDWAATPFGLTYPPSVRLWELAVPPAVSPQGCTPNSCWLIGGYAPCLATAASKSISWDQHGSRVSNTNDTSPVCMETYGGAGGPGSVVWPVNFPWLGEVDCFAADGTNGIFRQAFIWNTQVSDYFSNQFNIGAYSSSGKWWAMSSDWYCTLGTETGGATTICGLPYQPNHNYAVVGELLGPIQLSNSEGQVYQVTTAGTTDSGVMNGCGASGAQAAPACFCNTTGCTVTAGTATFTYVGKANAQSSLFIVKLQ